MLKRLFAHPLTLGIDVGDPQVTRLRRQIIENNVFLLRLYREWYRKIATALPQEIPGPILELGSGAGFLDVFIPDLITSDITPGARVQVLLDGRQLPFGDRSLRAITMNNVLHHIAHVESFFREVNRCLKPGGRLIMNEPWVTAWSRLIYRHLHHEPFNPESASWQIAASGPLSGANGALPWIIFQRDRHRFEATYPNLQIVSTDLHTPFRYLVSGGVSMRPLMPGWSFRFWRRLELHLARWMDRLANFALIILERRS